MQAIFLDIETSGLDPYKHRVLEIAFILVDAATGEELCTYNTIVRQSKEVWDSKDPVSIEVNGFTWEKLQSGKDEKAVRDEIITHFLNMNVKRGKSVFICQNPSFDRNFFSQIVDVYTQEQYNWPYHWLDLASMYWALNIKNTVREKTSFPNEFNLSKNAIAQQFHIPPEESPHIAYNGVKHLMLCYKTIVGFPMRSGV